MSAAPSLRCARCDAASSVDLMIARDSLATLRQIAAQVEARRVALRTQTDAQYAADGLSSLRYAAQAGGLDSMLSGLIETIGIYTESVAEHRKVADTQPAPAEVQP